MQGVCTHKDTINICIIICRDMAINTVGFFGLGLFFSKNVWKYHLKQELCCVLKM